MAAEWLFRGQELAGYLEERERRLRETIGSLGPAELAEDGLAARLTEEHRVEVPALRAGGAAVVEHGELETGTWNPVLLSPRGRAYRTVIAIPFEGHEELFRVQPSAFPSMTPRGEIRAGEVRIVCVREEQDPDGLRTEYEQTLRAIEEQLTRLRGAAERFNRSLEGTAARSLQARRNELGGPAAVATALGLGVREANPAAEKTGETATPPEGNRTERECQEALQIMRNMARVMELDPAAFARMGEEELRSHFLVQLNGRFGGGATGETFNFRGKTDILVRSGGENVLIGECKFWSGEIQLMGALDQVLSYLSWRDTRAALVLFQRQGSFSLVLDRIEATVPKHACFRRELARIDETTFRYEFSNPQDPARAVVLTIMAFDLPTVERGRTGTKLLTREKRAEALVELLARGGSLSYNEMASELQMPRDEAIDLVNRQLRGSGLLRKVRRGGQIAVALRSRKKIPPTSG